MTYNFKKARIAGALTLAFMAAVGNELTGYNLFDQEDGGNIICSIDPSCRKLTDNEIKLAKSVFGESINYKNVKVFNRYLFGWEPGDTSARMWNGNIYAINKDIHSQDYASEPTSTQSLFLHEMTHAWGYKNIPGFTIKGLSAIINADFNYSSLYKYDLEEGKSYFDYNLEQQADIVEDYYELTIDTIDAAPSVVTPQGTLCQKIRDYETVLTPVFPILPVTQCQLPMVKPS